MSGKTRRLSSAMRIRPGKPGTVSGRQLFHGLARAAALSFVTGASGALGALLVQLIAQ